MANTGIKGRIVDVETGAGISDLTVKAVDFDPFFNEDDTLASGQTDSSGNFELSYSADQYSLWKTDRNPDIVLQIFGPGGRLLHETEEAKDVTDETLNLPEIKIHSGNIDGWLVTHATLNPERGTPVFLFQGNEIQHLVDGDLMFPAITRAAIEAKTSINLMTLFFQVDDGLITQFKNDFDPINPPSSNCKNSIAATLEEELKKKAKPGQPDQTAIPVNVLVTNIPVSANDTVAEVREFFENTGVKTSDFNKGFALLHAKAITLDGVKAILMGSPLKQFYFSDGQHAIRDARHKGSLIHDVNLEVSGPAVEQIDKTFATIWKATGEPLITVDHGQIDEKQGDNIAAVQVLRTMPGGAFKPKEAGDEDLPHGETGILEAYQRAIALAERYIYLENQYFTSPDIVNALIHRMKNSDKPKLQIIIVLNFRPDLPGYADQQIQLINQLKIAASANDHQLGIYTLWSRSAQPAGNGDGGKKEFQIMPIYVHSKVAIIDDKWATVGSANLDGTSMNAHQIGLMVSSVIVDKLIDKVKLGGDFGKFLWDAYWYLFFFIFKQYLFNLKTLLIIIFIIYKAITDFKEIMETLTEITNIPDILKDVFTRSAQHALPHRSRQPSRSVELNLVLYNGVANQPETPVIAQLRNELWTEHLGLDSLPPDMQAVPDNQTDMKWVEFWDTCAQKNQEAIKKDEAPPENHTPKILAWTPETDAEDYLGALKIRTKNLRDKAFIYNFDKCKFETKKKLLPWPII
jgi:phosphatidylserine/phosphatidylglycerophosphate/cardiolipin synthase-like enzyme